MWRCVCLRSRGGRQLSSLRHRGLSISLSISLMHSGQHPEISMGMQTVREIYAHRNTSAHTSRLFQSPCNYFQHPGSAAESGGMSTVIIACLFLSLSLKFRQKYQEERGFQVEDSQWCYLFIQHLGIKAVTAHISIQFTKRSCHILSSLYLFLGFESALTSQKSLMPWWSEVSVISVSTWILASHRTHAKSDHEFVHAFIRGRLFFQLAEKLKCETVGVWQFVSNVCMSLSFNSLPLCYSK